jgi:hypothetical protein
MASGPRVFDRARDACLHDIDGNRLVEDSLAMGPS